MNTVIELKGKINVVKRNELEQLKSDGTEFVFIKKTDISPREFNVFLLYRKGFKNEAIAKALNVNNKTVSTYAGRLRQKRNIPLGANVYYLVTVYNKEFGFNKELETA